MNAKSLISTIIAVAFMGSFGYGAYLFFSDMEGPSVSISPTTGRVAPDTPITITLNDPSGVRSVTVAVRENNRRTEIFTKNFSPYKSEDSITFNLKNSPLREGAFEFEVKALDASLASFSLGNSKTVTIPMRLDTEPPRINISTLPPNVRRGGSAVIRYTINEDVEQSGVLVNDKLFSGFKQDDGSYICYFAFSHKLTPEEFLPKIMAKDFAGNTTTNNLRVHAIPRVFKEDIINLSDNFLERLSARLGHLAPNATTNFERFIIINKDIRLANADFLAHLSKQTSPKSMWKGLFLRLPRAASRAGYGDHRTYMYKGEVVDNQWHLGFDLASVRQAPIPAANTGKVIFAGELGIYGKLVVLDHGLGLMSLYSHLTNIQAKVGDMLNKGDTLGTTGETGMAFGDHLHFGILVGGAEVTPLEWLDPKWIRDNVTDRLKAK